MSPQQCLKCEGQSFPTPVYRCIWPAVYPNVTGLRWLPLRAYQRFNEGHDLLPVKHMTKVQLLRASADP